MKKLKSRDIIQARWQTTKVLITQLISVFVMLLPTYKTQVHTGKFVYNSRTFQGLLKVFLTVLKD